MTVNNGPVNYKSSQDLLRRGQSLRKKSNPDRPSKCLVRPLAQILSEESSSSLRTELDHQEFTILKTLCTGAFCKIYLARPELGGGKRALEQALVLKAFKTESTTEEEFFSEMELAYFLSPHPNIVTSFQVSFHWGEFRLFPMEHAPFGDLSRFLKRESPMTESSVKLVATQVSSALEFMHSLKLIHRDVVPENVLVFQKDCSLVKLSDFGSTVASRALLTKTSYDGGNDTTESGEGGVDGEAGKANNNRSRSNSVTGGSIGGGGGGVKYLPPEICSILPQEKYHCYSSIDVWQLGILLFACITGGGCPWKRADCIRDPGFNHYCDWLKRRCMKTPLAFQAFSPRFTRLLKRMLEPKPAKRCHIQEVTKYLKDDWLVGDSSSKSTFLIGGGALSKSPSFSGLLVSRSNSDNVGVVGGGKTKEKDPQVRTTTCKKSQSLGMRRKSGAARGKVCPSTSSVGEQLFQQKNNNKEPVFRICCKFQCKNQQPA